MHATPVIITVTAIVAAPIEKVWSYWNGPEHIVKWNQASADWHTTSATSDLRPGGTFTARMEAKDGSMGFDFAGVYDEVQAPHTLRYTLGDGRKVTVAFAAEGDAVKVTESFEAETMNPVELQREGWQAILDSFKHYTENN